MHPGGGEGPLPLGHPGGGVDAGQGERQPLAEAREELGQTCSGVVEHQAAGSPAQGAMEALQPLPRPRGRPGRHRSVAEGGGGVVGGPNQADRRTLGGEGEGEHRARQPIADHRNGGAQTRRLNDVITR
jgi:hypothetical protein